MDGYLLRSPEIPWPVQGAVGTVQVLQKLCTAADSARGSPHFRKHCLLSGRIWDGTPPQSDGQYSMAQVEGPKAQTPCCETRQTLQM